MKISILKIDSRFIASNGLIQEPKKGHTRIGVPLGNDVRGCYPRCSGRSASQSSLVATRWG